MTAHRLHDEEMRAMLERYHLQTDRERREVALVYETHYPVLRFLPLAQAMNLIGRVTVERLAV